MTNRQAQTHRALKEWHRRVPDYAIKAGHEELEYPTGLKHVKNLMLAWGTE